MLNDTTLALPFIPSAAVSALVECSAATGATGTATTRKLVTPPTSPVPLGLFAAGAALAVSVSFFDSTGTQINADGPTSDPTTATVTLPSGPDSPLSLTITTRPSPTPVGVA